MELKRIVRHMICMPFVVKKRFPPALMAEIEKIISESEQTHDGQICFCVENALDLSDLIKDTTARQRAEEVFSKLRVWNTEQNCGVLIYVLFADHQLEIVADRGISKVVPQSEWEKICLLMEASFKRKNFAEGVKKGLSEISSILSAHFPARKDKQDELSNRPVML